MAEDREMLWFGGFGPDRFQPFFCPSGTVVGGEQVMGIRGMDSTVMLWCPHADSTWTLELDVASGSAGLECHSPGRLPSSGAGRGWV